MFDEKKIARNASSTSEDGGNERPTALTEEEIGEVMVEIRF